MGQVTIISSEEVTTYPTRYSSWVIGESGPEGWSPDTTVCSPQSGTRFVHLTQRPHVSLCISDTRFPVLYAPWMVGFLQWPLALFRPLHQDRIPGQRLTMTLLVGLGVLLAAYRLIAAYAGTRPAALGVLLCSVSPMFTFVQFWSYETLPFLFLLLGLMVVLGPLPGRSKGSSGAPTPTLKELSLWRLVLASMCFGLALAANLKFLLFVLPLLAVCWRLVGLRAPFKRWIPWRRAALGGCLLLLPSAPIVVNMVSTGILDASAGRLASLGVMLRQMLDPLRHARMLWHAAAQQADPTSVSSPVSMEVPAVDLSILDFSGVESYSTLMILGIIVVSFIYSFRLLVLKSGSVIIGIVCSYIVSVVAAVSVVYHSWPFSFAPLFAAIGLAGGGLVSRMTLGRVDEKGRTLHSLLLGGGIGALLLLSTLSTIQRLSEAPVPWLPEVGTATAAHLKTTLGADADRSVVFTIDGLAGGVVDSETEGAVRTVEVHRFMSVCFRSEEKAGGAETSRECLDHRWQRLLEHFAGYESHMLLAPNLDGLGGALAAGSGRQFHEMADSWQATVQRLGGTTTLDWLFRTDEGTQVVRLYRGVFPQAEAKVTEEPSSSPGP
jgi:hypothetical protein